MKRNPEPALLFFCALLFLWFAGVVQAEDLDIVNRPVNISGLTGLPLFIKIFRVLKITGIVYL